MGIWPDEWLGILAPQVPIAESVVRASALYLFAFLLLRVVLKRESGGLGISDLLVLILVAAAAHGPMSARAYGVVDGLVLVATIVVWDWALNFAAFRFAWFGRLVRPRPVPLIRDGRILFANARKELLTRGEIEEQIRLHGLESVADVAAAFMEPDGEISVIPKRPGNEGGQPPPRRSRELRR